jgi:hypothetical protein
MEEEQAEQVNGKKPAGAALKQSSTGPFQGNKAVKGDVLGLIHNTHPAPTEFFDYALVQDGLTDHRVRQSHA